MNKVEEKVSALFENRKDIKALYVFEDGNIFADEGFAKAHQRSTKANYTTYTRQAGALKQANAVEKALQEELLGIDLTALDGNQQPRLLKIAKGLNVKVANNKIETLIAALTEVKDTLTLNKQ